MHPPWLKKKLVVNDTLSETRKALSDGLVHTVCESSLCPNQNECFSNGQATFLLLGDICTRSCTFCSAKSGPAQGVDTDEPRKILDAVIRLGIRYAVITSVTRDDLADGGAGQFVEVIRSIRRYKSAVKVEVLTPDFSGNMDSVKRVVEAAPDVFGHNIETVERLYDRVRPGAGYRRSLDLLKYVKGVDPARLTKSSIMLGLGEKEAEVLKSMKGLRDAGCDILTLGQYLRPRQDNIPVSRYVTPQEFDKYKETAIGLGFRAVVAGPFVRSSYLAEETYGKITRRIYDRS